MNYTELISKGIKNVRLSLGLTQERFAEQIDMSVQGYRNIEQGKYLPTAKTIDTICLTFNINPVDLLIPKSSSNVKEMQDIIIAKLKSCDLEKLIKVNKVLDLF